MPVFLRLVHLESTSLTTSIHFFSHPRIAKVKLRQVAHHPRIFCRRTLSTDPRFPKSETHHSGAGGQIAGGGRSQISKLAPTAIPITNWNPRPILKFERPTPIRPPIATPLQFSICPRPEPLRRVVIHSEHLDERLEMISIEHLDEHLPQTED